VDRDVEQNRRRRVAELASPDRHPTVYDDPALHADAMLMSRPAQIEARRHLGDQDLQKRVEEAQAELAKSLAERDRAMAPPASADDRERWRQEDRMRRYSASPGDIFVSRNATPSVGNWGWANWILWWIGGLWGYYVVRKSDPVRAKHILKWGWIWTAIRIGNFVIMGILGAIGAATDNQSGY
jgi:hypothetical protein